MKPSFVVSVLLLIGMVSPLRAYPTKKTVTALSCSLNIGSREGACDNCCSKADPQKLEECLKRAPLIKMGFVKRKLSLDYAARKNGCPVKKGCEELFDTTDDVKIVVDGGDCD